MSTQAMRQALEALEYHTAQTRPIERTNIAITALRTALDAPQQPVAWPCEAVTADFEENTITLEMRGTDWHVSAGEYLLIPPAAPKD